jgi:hypothetical protein
MPERVRRSPVPSHSSPAALKMLKMRADDFLSRGPVGRGADWTVRLHGRVGNRAADFDRLIQTTMRIYTVETLKREILASTAGIG